MSASAFSADDERSVAPAVFEPEYFDGDRLHEEDAAHQQPTAPSEQPVTPQSLLYTPVTASKSGEAQLALKPLEDGRLAMLAFTSLELLVSGCGENQPWVALPENTFEEVFHASGADVVAVDAGLTSGQRWGEENEPHTLDEFRTEQGLTGRG